MFSCLRSSVSQERGVQQLPVPKKYIYRYFATSVSSQNYLPRLVQVQGFLTVCVRGLRNRTVLVT